MATKAQLKARERESKKTLEHLAQQGNKKAQAAIGRKAS
jgi:hypothetical protein